MVSIAFLSRTIAESDRVAGSRRRSRLVVPLLVLGLWAVTCAPVFGQTVPSSAMQQIEALLHEKAKRTPAQRKMDSHLHLVGQGVRGAVTSAAIPSLSAMADRLELDDAGNVHVDIQATVTAVLETEIVALGGTVESSFPAYRAIRAWIPLLAAETLAAHPDVTFIEPAALATTNVRPINTKSLLSHGVDVVLNKGVTGSGVKVGVLSDGIKSLATLQAAGNLPAVTVLSGQAGPANGDEGTAMLEIVYDLAPSAQLLFATAFNSEASFATNIQNLAAAGARIIVDDVNYFDEGTFQDGIVARAVNTVTNNGVLYLSAAGNSGNLDSGTSGTWEGDFVDSGTSISIINTAEGRTVPVHAFDATHNFNQVIAASSNASPATLKWSDPLGASTNDYDLFVLNSTMTTVVASSTNFQTGTQDPVEIVAAPAAGTRIVVVLFSGFTRALSLSTNRGRLAIATRGATYGHNAAASALTVAATAAQSSIFTSGTPLPETFSSDGPRRIFYTPNGTAITPGNFLFATNGGTTLSKVDLTAADGGQSAVAGFNPFFGTSAAAPTAAAIAALVWSAHPALTASDVAGVMENSALAARAGFSSSTVGRGIVMANLAVTTFVDVLGNHPTFAFIEALARAGITGGCAVNPALYCPDDQVTREQMAVLLLRGIHGPAYTPPAPTGLFVDVPLTSGFAKWIEQLAREGITGGCGTAPPQYCPAASVTRAEMAVFLLRAKHGAAYQPPPATGMFADVPVSDVFARWIEQLAREGITGGCATSPAQYCPDSPLTRAQMAIFLVRTFNIPL